MLLVLTPALCSDGPMPGKILALWMPVLLTSEL